MQTYYTTFTYLPVVKYLGYDKLRVQLKTGHKGKKGTPPLSEGVPYEITLIRLSQVSLDRRRREKVIWEMITEHSCNPFADLEC